MWQIFIYGKTILLAMAKDRERKESVMNRIAAALNKGIIPLEYSYDKLKKLAKHVEKTAPLVYGEVENLIKSNIVTLDKKSRFFKKSNLAKFGETITSSLIRKIPNMDEKELMKIVRHKKSQTFIDMLAKGLSTGEKEYTILPKEKKFSRVLIANRGEIALRIIRACRELGIETVLVYSNTDKNTLPVKFADMAYPIGAAVSYLDIKR